MARMVGTSRWWMACAVSSLVHVLAFTMLPPPGSLRATATSAPTQTVMIDLMPPPPPPEAAPAEKPEPEEPERDPEELEAIKQLALGIDADTPDSDTWLGHDTFIEHRAVPAEFDQAAFTTGSASATPASLVQPNSTEVSPAPVASPQQQIADAPLPQATPAADKSSDQVPLPNTSDVAPPAVPLDEGMMPEPNPEPVSQQDAKAEAESDPQHVLEAVMMALGLTVPPPSTESTAEPQLSTPPAQNEPDPSSIGERSDKQSDPTSVINVPRDQWQLGKPLAAHGLQLKPVKPKLTVLTSMTAAPCNPLAVLRFESNGVPKDVTLLQGSCDSRVDEAVLSALYRWRAEGKELLALGPGETVDIRIRLILNPRGRTDDDA